MDFKAPNHSIDLGMAEGGAQPNISKEKIVNSILPLPPLDEILPLCERLK